MKLGIVSQSTLLTVFIRENMARGLFSHTEGIKVTHGKLWGNLVCLFEPEGNAEMNTSRLFKLLAEYKIGQVLSLGIGRTVLPLLNTGDVIVSSEAVHWQPGSQGAPEKVKSVEAHPKLLDQALNSIERYRTEEVGSRAIVGSVNSYPAGDYCQSSGNSRAANNVQCWDKDGYFLAEYCDRAQIPWALVRLILKGESDLEKVSPVVKWDMAKKCFWIVKGILESNKRSKINKRAW